MQSIAIDITKPKGEHTMACSLLGDWVIWRCPICPYEVRINNETGERLVSRKTSILHSGFSGWKPEVN